MRKSKLLCIYMKICLIDTCTKILFSFYVPIFNFNYCHLYCLYHTYHYSHTKIAKPWILCHEILFTSLKVRYHQSQDNITEMS